MQRTIDEELIKWKNNEDRMPLVIRGARQVGKSYSIENFGTANFKYLATLNFEFQTEAQNCFESLDPKKIITKIELLLNIPIKEGETLLFLDEIQKCPKALTALRYFKEKLPNLHVIAAGSLLEFTINDEKFSFPVGRVEFMYLRPLSFNEFLKTKNERLLEYLENVSIKEEINETAHNLSLNLLKEYFFIGGMPEVVNSYLKTNSFLNSLKIQEALLTAYENDFGKYASKTQHKYLQILFQKAPEFLGKHVKFSKIDPSVSNPAREFKKALTQLCHAGLLQQIFVTKANGLPLRSEINPKKFKLLFLDVGLYQRSMKIDPNFFTNLNLMQINNGQLAEQFAGQELLAYSPIWENTKLYFWERSKKGSDAEIDYLKIFDSKIIPIEVKAGKTGRLKSLMKFLEEKKSKIGITISEKPLSYNNNVLSIPLYLIKQLPKLLVEILKK